MLDAIFKAARNLVKNGWTLIPSVGLHAMLDAIFKAARNLVKNGWTLIPSVIPGPRILYTDVIPGPRILYTDVIPGPRVAEPGISTNTPGASEDSHFRGNDVGLSPPSLLQY